LRDADVVVRLHTQLKRGCAGDFDNLDQKKGETRQREVWPGSELNKAPESLHVRLGVGLHEFNPIALGGERGDGFPLFEVQTAWQLIDRTRVTGSGQSPAGRFHRPLRNLQP